VVQQLAGGEKFVPMLTLLECAYHIEHLLMVRGEGGCWQREGRTAVRGAITWGLIKQAGSLG